MDIRKRQHVLHLEMKLCSEQNIFSVNVQYKRVERGAEELFCV